MDKHGLLVVSALFALLAVLVLSLEWLFVFVTIAVSIGACVLGLALGVRSFLARPGSGKIDLQVRKKPSQDELSPSKRAELVLEYLQVKGQTPWKKKALNSPDLSPKHSDAKCLPVVFGRMVDAVLQQLLDYALRDYLANLLQGLCASPDQLTALLREDIWEGIKNLHERLAQVDQTQLVACDMITRVTTHFERLRLAQGAAIRVGGPAVIHVAPYVEKNIKEEDFIRSLSEMAVVLLMPEIYSSSQLLRLLVREVLALAILLPAVDLICDPDFINQKIIAYIHHQQKSRAKKRQLTNIENYEEMIKKIKDCDDLDILKHIRYNIVTEILQVNVKFELAKEAACEEKTDSNDVRRLGSYLNQLLYAKRECEKRLRAMGWKNFADETGSEAVDESQQQFLPLVSIIENNEGRKYLRKFLQHHSSEMRSPESIDAPTAYLDYWATAEKMRLSPRQMWHQLAQELYYTHIYPPSSLIKVDKAIKKRMEAFLLGDQGPEVFYEVQDDVVGVLQEKYYPIFVASENYNKMITVMEEAALNDHENNEGLNEEKSEKKNNKFLFTESNSPVDPDANKKMSNAGVEPPNCSRRKLMQLEEKLITKKQALQALRTSLKPEAKALMVLEQEVARLEGEHRQLEAHLTRTETWGEHLGRWRAMVQSTEMPDEREPPQFVLVVHVLEDEHDADAISTGWVVLRGLPDFLELHRKLCQLDSSVKNLELPSFSGKFLFGKTLDKPALEKAKFQIQNYLERILGDDRLNTCEAIYTFLSPSADLLKHASPSPKKHKFSLSTLFKSNGSSGSLGIGEDNFVDPDLIFDDESRVDGSGGPRGDAVAEPLYSLLGEIFDLRGLFRWLRRSLITFVQITYGRTITRQVRETVGWIFSEPMLHFYLQVFISAWWPHGQLAPPAPQRSEKEKETTKKEARQLFVDNVPEILCNLVGKESARRGARKVFEALQEKVYNKQLIYELLEVILYQTFPKELMSSPRRLAHFRN
ncbi:sorting nexin-25 [Neocloeon triangulifer]|uniref:sorting nexin-25 n=1 Tax=Neocloeon triangulifer TaxID=2078957 RepID=UPI00286F69C5|nr:sorting nexin-25 [Neocloeon triangulifer]